MENRIRERLDVMVEWLKKDELNYSKKDFKDEVNRMLDAVDEALWCGIISDNQYYTLKDLIVRKTINYV